MAPVTDGDKNSTNEEDQDYSLAKNRSRREKTDRHGRLAALAKLKNCKLAGEKYKPEILEEKNVYEEVDEGEYSRIVRERQDDDWIIDDGTGYVEDGREFFDDEVDDEGESSSKKKKGREKEKQKSTKNPNIRAPDSKPSNIKSMFAAAAVKPKRKVESTSLNEDDLLGDIISEMKQGSSSSFMPPPVKLKKKPATHSNPFGVSPSVPTPNVPRAAAKPARAVPILSTNDFATKKKSAPKPAWFSATDDVCNDVEPVVDKENIEEFVSQDVDMGDQTIEDVIDDAELAAVASADNEMDVSGINFDDNDFDVPTPAVKNTKANQSTSNGSASGSFLDSQEVSNFSQWQDASCESESLADIHVDGTQIPLTKKEDGEEVLRMFWLDAYEDYFKQPGVVYLFGKVYVESAQTYASCCCVVKNIERQLYLLPRNKRLNSSGESSEDCISFMDVYKEFEVIAEKHKIMTFKSKKITKSYAFEKEGVPVESDYLEVRYSAEFPALPSDLSGETFSNVFGANTSALEIFLLNRKIKGPTWLDISLPQISSPNVTWCKFEVFVPKPDQIRLTTDRGAAPPLVVLTMSLRTLPNSKTHQNEIIGASCLVHQEFHMDKAAPKPPYQSHFCAITKPTDCIFPFDFKEKLAQKMKSTKVDMVGTERALLGFLLAKIHKIDPDIIVGHDIAGFDLDVLLHRLNYNKIANWSRIGRLKRANMPKFTGSGARIAGTVCGRLVCDVMISAKELIRCRSFDLTELVTQILKDKRHEIDPEMIRPMFNNSDDLIQLVTSGLVDATFALRIMCELNVLPLALQITNICGNIMTRTLMGGRSERNEYLLLHAFTEKGFIVPDKTYGKKHQTHHAAAGSDDEDETLHSTKKTGRKKPAYTGGLVLEPKKGFYDRYILLLDFNSLYPSIIQEYNICFTTISLTSVKEASQLEEDGDYDESLLPEEGLEPGILPTEIRKLVQSRRQVRQMMKASDITPDQLLQYDIRQKALKLTANSMYGCLGFAFSRFYAKRLAALVTGKGREILLKTKDLVQAMNLDVIYGDTDSIMVNTGLTDIDEVFKLGNKIKAEVNKLYRLLEIDIDGVFKSMLLLKKKKYAALSMQKVNGEFVTTQEMKGLDIVRRDWCNLAKEAGNFVVSQILSGESRETIVENIHDKLIEVGQKVKDGQIPEEFYHITKQLTKNPEEYPDKNSLPHVQVALRLNSKGGRKLRAGDIVYYVICLDGSNLPHSQRGYHPDELSKRDDLQIDTKYYLSQQVHPVVSRLCDPIDGTDAAIIAECLGLDPSGYRHSISKQESNEDDALLGGALVSDEEKYKDCERFKFSCVSCSQENVIESIFLPSENPDDRTLVLTKCTNPSCSEVPLNKVEQLQNKLCQSIRSHIRKYYEGWLLCEDAACGNRTRRFPLVFNHGQPVCQVCHRGILHLEYTDRCLYLQLGFYQSIFDLEKAISSIVELSKRDKFKKSLTDQQLDNYRTLKNYVEKRIGQSAYADVNLARLFEGLVGAK